MIFTRKRNTGDADHDITLYCQSILFAWAENIISKSHIIEVYEPRFEEVSETETCFCPTTGTTPMPSPTVTPTTPTAVSTSLVNVDPECPSNCSVALNLCQNSLLCRTLWERYQMACHLNESDGVGNSSLCSDECRLAAENLKSDEHGLLYTCCFCDDEICTQQRKNFEESCGISTAESDVCNMMRNSCNSNNEDSKHVKLMHT